MYKEIIVQGNYSRAHGTDQGQDRQTSQSIVMHIRWDVHSITLTTSLVYVLHHNKYEYNCLISLFPQPDIRIF